MVPEVKVTGQVVEQDEGSEVCEVDYGRCEVLVAEMFDRDVHCSADADFLFDGVLVCREHLPR